MQTRHATIALAFSQIRDIKPTTAGDFGRGIAVEPASSGVTRLTVKRSVLTGLHDSGIYLQGWTVTGGMVCGCGEATHACHAQSANLAPLSAPRPAL